MSSLLAATTHPLVQFRADGNGTGRGDARPSALATVSSAASSILQHSGQPVAVRNIVPEKHVVHICPPLAGGEEACISGGRASARQMSRTNKPGKRSTSKSQLVHRKLEHTLGVWRGEKLVKNAWRVFENRRRTAPRRGVRGANPGIRSRPTDAKNGALCGPAAWSSSTPTLGRMGGPSPMAGRRHNGVHCGLHIVLCSNVVALWQ